MDPLLNARIIIDNRGGAGGTVGASAAAKMAPDGYTFFVGAAHHTIAPWIYPNLDYDLEKSFIPIGMIARPPQVVSVNPQKVKAKTLAEFIADAKANPNKYNYGSSGNGSVHHMAGELFKIAAGVQLTHVPYRGVGPAMQDLVAGNIDLMFDGSAPRPTRSRPARSTRSLSRPPSARAPSRTFRPPARPACRATRSPPGTRSGPSRARPSRSWSA